jgi:hypothetical protein
MMVILGKPRNDISKYVGIQSKEVNKKLQSNRFFPLYWSGDTMYYIKNKKLEEFLRKVGIGID